MKKTFSENRIFVINDPAAPRLSPDLAIEIGNMLESKSGINESLILLQIEFWIAVNGVWKEGKKWYYKSSRDIADFFKIMSHQTVNRSIKNLESLRLIELGNFNKRRSDNTPWFTLNYEGISKLKSITLVTQNSCNKMLQPVTKRDSLSQNVTDLFSNVTDLSQNVTAKHPNVTALQERYENKRDLSKKDSEKLKPEREILFNNFWKSYYPHERRGSEQRAKEYFNRLILTKNQYSGLISSLKNYKLTKTYGDGCIMSAYRFITEYENYMKT